jgi:hypothetical protein
MITKNFLRLGRLLIAVLLSVSSLSSALAQIPAGISRSAQVQIQALLDEKAARTPVEQKLDSQLVYALKQASGTWARGLPPLQIVLRQDNVGRVLVDIEARVDQPLLALIARNNGIVVKKVERFDSIRAWVPLGSLRALAAPQSVRFIAPAAEAELNRVTTNPKTREALRKQLRTYMATSPGAEPNTGAVNSQGDVTHRADLARAGLVFSGIKIGILSDSIDDAAGSYAAAIASGDVPVVTVLPGESGGTATAEGLAMLEIVYDLCPGAQLYFATAFGGPSSFAQNILDLRAAGCDVIVDDVGYFNESPFFDDVISQAVTTVSASGAFYFSSSGNAGTKTKNSAGVWLGDFLDGGPVAPPLTSPGTSRVHTFTDSVTMAQGLFTAFPSSGSTGSSRRGDLFWSDPDNGSANDYDLFYLDNTGATVIASSTNVQTGTQDPYENFSLPTAGPFVGRRFIIVKAAAAAVRYLYLGSGRGYLTLSTPGQTKGHSTAGTGFGVAATPTGAPSGGGNPAFPPTAGPFPGVFNTGNKTEIFSSQGFRKYFYNPDGSPVTPGDLTATGGAIRSKPDFTAADGVSTTLPASSGLNPFYGTSAAAPHAGAIAAILKAKNPTLTVAQVRTALVSTAIDIELAGNDNVAGAGILDALAAANTISPSAGLAYRPGNVRMLSPTGNGQLDRNSTAKLFITVTNASGSTAAATVTASVSSTTTGVLVSSGTMSYGTLPPGGSAENAAPFLIKTLSNLGTGPVDVNVSASINGGPPVVYPLSFNIN